MNKRTITKDQSAIKAQQGNMEKGDWGAVRDDIVKNGHCQ